MNLLDLLAGSDEQIALVTPGRPTLTYKQLRENVVELVSQLNSFGLKRGNRIALAIPNSPEMIITFLASALCAIACPLNSRYKKEEFSFYYKDTQAKALITLPGTVEQALAALTPEMMLLYAHTKANGTLRFEGISEVNCPHPVEVASPDDVAVILHTSGTTSRPKRVPIRHRHLAASAAHIQKAYSLMADDKTLLIMPLFHIHGLVGSMLSTFASGGTVICPVGFNSLEFWQLVEKFKPTWYSAAPTIHQMVLDQANNNLEIVETNRFRFVRSSSAPLSPIVIEQMEATLKAPVLESYSMTEAAHMMTTNPLPPTVRKLGSVGYSKEVKVEIMDKSGNLLPKGKLGEVVIKGTNIIDGYEHDPEVNASAFVNGWFRTGDQGKLDEDGYLFLTGRLKELINRGGEKISPVEIDDVLLRHPAVKEALAFAVTHKTLGENIHAALVLNTEVDEQELRLHCLERLADFKVPARFHILDELPRGDTGKLQRLSMAKLLNIKPPEERQQQLQETIIFPSDTVEIKLAKIWERVLDVSPIGVKDNFFELGGDSLKAFSLLEPIQQQFGKELTASILFQGPTIEHLALAIREEINIQSWSPLVPLQPNGSKQPFFCVPGVEGIPIYLYQLAQALGSDQPFYGLQARGLDGKSQPFTQLEDMAAYYIQAIQAVQPNGPYLLGGHCFGSKVAFEMAQQFQQKGHEVALVAIFDAPPPILQLNTKLDDIKLLSGLLRNIELMYGKKLDISNEFLQSLAPDKQLKYIGEQLQQINFSPSGSKIQLPYGI
ncbi:AMP-binding protein [Nostoc sp. C117]|uniref:AMP-binding protein n=1 Tax=Nostoc sp. C117 TaxID=3349875 RepID=UPI00370DD7DA